MGTKFRLNQSEGQIANAAEEPLIAGHFSWLYFGLSQIVAEQTRRILIGLNMSEQSSLTGKNWLSWTSALCGRWAWWGLYGKESHDLQEQSCDLIGHPWNAQILFPGPRNVSISTRPLIISFPP